MNKDGLLPKIIKRQEDGSYTVHDQIIHFVDGHKRYISRVKWIWENEMIHLITENDIEFIINKKNVLFIQRRISFKNDSF
jgi:Tfp pilus assembly ATPase PilU